MGLQTIIRRNSLNMQAAHPTNWKLNNMQCRYRLRALPPSSTAEHCWMIFHAVISRSFPWTHDLSTLIWWQPHGVFLAARQQRLSRQHQHLVSPRTTLTQMAEAGGWLAVHRRSNHRFDVWCLTGVFLQQCLSRVLGFQQPTRGCATMAR
jgi:hypothetical protein